MYAGLLVSMIWANCLFPFEHVFSFEKSRRSDDNHQTTVTHLDEKKELHLESSEQNDYIIYLHAIIKAIFIHAWICWSSTQRPRIVERRTS